MAIKKSRIINSLDTTKIDIDWSILDDSEEDDDKMYLVKHRIRSLDECDRILFMLYIESDYNINVLSKMFNCSWPAINKYIIKIKQQIL